MPIPETAAAAPDHRAFETLMRQHNGRLFRVARAILKDDAEAEDVLQDAYLDAYRHLPEFRGDSQIGTWLVRIVANRSLMHKGVNKSAVDLVTKLKVTPQENDTSRALKAGGEKNVANLKKLKGAAFDKAYIDHEVAYHAQVLEALDKTLLPNAKNAELKALLVKVRPAFVAHLEHARHLQSSLKSAN
jgi:RNA polymerase sigma factor (sigma-70 family)